MAATPPARRPWKWAPEPGLWETACGDDVVAQLHAAADAGFAAFADPELMRYSPTLREALALAVQLRGMTLGPARNIGYVFPRAFSCYREPSRIGVTGWRSEAESRPFHFSRVSTPAGRTVVVQSLRTFLAHYQHKFAVMMPDARPFPMLVDPLITDRSHERWYEYFAEIVHEVNHPLCRLVADSYRLASAGIDVVDYMHRHAAILGHVELADYPGGFEPGSGTLDIDGIVAATALSPHDGLIGLRCGLSQPGSKGLSRLIAAAKHHQGLAG